MTDKVHETPRCDGCPGDTLKTDSWGNKDANTAIVGTQPGSQHPDESDACFGLDLDWTAWSGEILEDLFDELEADISDYYWCNAVKCVEGPESCAENLKVELSGFSKIILLGNETVELAPEFEGADVYKVWHPAYVHRNRRKFSQYVRRWKDVLAADTPNTLSDWAD